MSRLESDQEIEFKINKEVTDESAVNSFPLKSRKQAIEDFDKETEIVDVDRVAAAPLSGDIAKLLESADTLYEANDFNPAHDLYEAVLKRDHQNEQALKGLASTAIHLDHGGEAILAIRKLVQLHPSFSNYVWLADELYLDEKLDEAQEFYMKAQLQPHFESEVLFKVFKNLGNIALRNSDLDAAEEYYNKAFTLQPDSDALLVNFGSLSIHRGELDVAVRRFRQAVEINSANEKAWIGLGMIHREFGDSELAWANIERALDLDNGNETAIKLICEWAMKDNEVARAIQLNDLYLINKPQDAFIHMMQAKFLFLLARIEEARIEIEEALSQQPEIEDGAALHEVIMSEINQREAQFK